MVETKAGFSPHDSPLLVSALIPMVCGLVTPRQNDPAGLGIADRKLTDIAGCRLQSYLALQTAKWVG
jgi:hypothetical protein